MPDLSDNEQLLSELNLGSARGKRQTSFDVTVVRSLNVADVDLLVAPPPVDAPLRGIQRITAAHHQLAQMLARGSEDVEASLITGYSTTYISNIKRDPSFAELLAHYTKERQLVFIDVVEQMKTLGLCFKDELQRRLEEAPEKFSRQEVMQAIDLLLIKPQQAKGAGSGVAVAVPPVSVNVKFVTATEKQKTVGAVDLDYEDVDR